MPSLTRRRSDDTHRESWAVYDRQACQCTGRCRPMGLVVWFYPGLHPGQHQYGSAEDFETARAGFEEAWQRLLPEIPEGAFEQWHHDRETRAEIAAIHARGEKLPTEFPNSMMRCICGAFFDSYKPADSYDHRGHIYAAQDKGLH